MILVSLMMNARARLLVLGALLATSFASPTSAQSSQALERAKKKIETVMDGGVKPLVEDAHYASGYWAIGDDYYKGISTKEEMLARVAKMNENRNERRKAHLDGLLLKWGARDLDRPGAREEHRIHARRMARTSRALFLAHTEPSVKDRAELVARLEGLVEWELGRYADAIRALRPPAPAASASAPPAPVPATSTGAVGQ